MTIIVTDEGFTPDTWNKGYAPLHEAANDTPALGCARRCRSRDDTPLGRDDPDRLSQFCRRAGLYHCPHAAIAWLYGTSWRAKGHVISDQYAMARRTGFDEVEISQALAARQPEDEWRMRARWQDHDYQSLLRGA